MPIFIYNSLTRKKEPFEPISPPQVNIYTCGVTVYDECHIGHARSLYVFDVIRRYLEYKGFKVNFVRNITDIDDKIINRANELKVNWQDLVDRYIKSYYEDLSSLGIRLGIRDGQEEPRATKNIEEIKKYIEALIDKGYAYVTGTGVYFNVRKFTEYGKLSGQSIEDMLTGVRKESDETKQDPLDFALWKKSKLNEPFWPSPWGEGRPGWHIECSVMSTKYLGTDALDIHAGGRDLIFPHHENEIAQSEAESGRQFAKYWIHHGLLTINGQKMAKSLGNFITIKDFVAKYSADVLKFFFLQTHYSHPIDFTEYKIEEAKKQKYNFDEFFNRVNTWDPLNKGTEVSFSNKDKVAIDNICTEFEKAMDDDFNTPRALASLFELTNIGFVFISKDNKDAFEYIKSKLEIFFGILGLTVVFTRKLSDDEKKKIAEMDTARKNKDYPKADSIREELKNIGINVSTTSSSITISFIEREGK